MPAAIRSNKGDPFIQMIQKHQEQEAQEAQGKHKTEKLAGPFRSRKTEDGKTIGWQTTAEAYWYLIEHSFIVEEIIETLYHTDLHPCDALRTYIEGDPVSGGMRMRFGEIRLPVSGIEWGELHDLLINWHQRTQV